MARSKADATYSFKKGKSRSKKYCEAVEPTTAKRSILTFDTRVESMKRLEEGMQNMKERISYKEKRRQMVESVKIIRLVMILQKKLPVFPKTKTGARK